MASITEMEAEVPNNNDIDTMFVLDFGLQTRYLILRRLRVPNVAVGVQGDARLYGYIGILRDVRTADFTSGEPFDFDFSPLLLKKISTRIANEVEGVSRAVYDIASKPSGTIELE
ncbi:GMP synthase C terminal domain-containing protein [Colletotrichum cereale]|nr:GMP synthase C terminal domain-containing protein [Colletotrichum cereale]